MALDQGEYTRLTESIGAVKQRLDAVHIFLTMILGSGATPALGIQSRAAIRQAAAEAKTLEAAVLSALAD